MSLPGAGQPESRRRSLWWAALAVAAGQIAFAARIPSVQDYLAATVVGWGAALFVASSRARSEPWPVAAPRWLERALGAFAVAGAVGALASAPVYRSFDRALPLVAGAGIALAAAGIRGLRFFRRELLFLALPFINPPPWPLRRILDVALLPAMAWCAAALDQAVGHPVTAQGNILYAPGDTLRVVSGCSGLLGVSRLWLLAALVVALFPTTRAQRIVLFASGVLIGLPANALRVAALGVAVSRGDVAAFDYWHVGDGASAFTIATAAIACAAWWLLFRIAALPAMGGAFRWAPGRGEGHGPHPDSR